jgi:hypothetical protein
VYLSRLDPVYQYSALFLSVSELLKLPFMIYKVCYPHGSVKIKTIWDVTQCSLIDGSQHFGGTCYLHLQSRNSDEKRSESLAASVPSFGAI